MGIYTVSTDLTVAAEQSFTAANSRAYSDSSKARFAALLQPAAPLPIFQQTWWQTIARGRKTLIVEQVAERGAIVGQVSYTTSKNRVGFVFGEVPYWTHLSGPWISDALDDAEKSRVLEELVSRLPKSICFELICHPRKSDAALFRDVLVKAGFTVEVQNTYTEAPDSTPVMSRINAKHRKNLIRTAKRLNITELDADEFINFYADNLDARAVESYAPLEIARDLIVEGMRRNPAQVKVFAASKKEPFTASKACRLDAAIACAWDSERYYYFMSTRKRTSGGDPECKPHADAVKLLMVHAMAHARSLGLVFDADGVTEPGTEKLYRDILKIPELEHRYVLKRDGGLHNRCKAIKLEIAEMATRIGVPASLLARTCGWASHRSRDRG
jgi:hypothetical protein